MVVKVFFQEKFSSLLFYLNQPCKAPASSLLVSPQRVSPGLLPLLCLSSISRQLTSSFSNCSRRLCKRSPLRNDLFTSVLMLEQFHAYILCSNKNINSGWLRESQLPSELLPAVIALHKQKEK